MTKPHPGTSGSARLHDQYTEDGYRVREVLSYARRSARLTPKQHRAWETYADRWVVGPQDLAEVPGETDWSSVFGREAPLVVEIGSGVGEAAAAYAAAHPEHDVLAIEVWKPGVADLLHRAAAVGAENVRALVLDAEDSFEHFFAPGTVHEVWTFFPDPWPKKRHHKRRLVTATFADHVQDVLEPGGTWRLATDWPPYATWMQDVLDAHPGFTGGVVERWDGRPVTKFERRGLAEERASVDLAYTLARST